MYYAHSANGLGQRQELLSHLRAVADAAESFAAAFGAGEAGRLVGLCHDLGKLSTSFQDYLLDSEGNPGRRRHGPDHKAAGAMLASQRVGLAALAVRGHHGGLDTPSALKAWLGKLQGTADVREALAVAEQVVPDISRSRCEVPAALTANALSAEFFVRMIFSALVDADFLDTEGHFNLEASQHRGVAVGVEELQRSLARYVRRFEGRSDVVGQIRREVYLAFRLAAENWDAPVVVTIMLSYCLARERQDSPPACRHHGARRHQ